MDCLATRNSVNSFVQVKQLKLLGSWKKADPCLFVCFPITQETYSVQKYLEHLQNALDIFYEEVSF